MSDEPFENRFWNDVATLDDGFDITPAGDRVAKIVLEAETPFTLGVTGKWGSGKTSVLRRAFASLQGQQIRAQVPFSDPIIESSEERWNRWSWEGENREAELGFEEWHIQRARRSLCVWFSPWQHQNAENPLVPLLREIRDQFSWRAKVLDGSEKNLRRGLLAGFTLLERVVDGALSLSAGKAVKLATGTTKAVREAWSDGQDPARLDDGQRFHLIFQDAIATALDGLPVRDGREEGGSSTGFYEESAVATWPEGRLIVFVDDLDRCEEKVVVDLLEAIKLYLGSERCVFVLGIDQSAVLDAMSRVWVGRSQDFNREYLQKLFQAVLPVPMPRPGSMRESVRGLLEKHGWEDADECSEMIVKLLEPNPRKLKNFVNEICANRALYRASSDELEAQEFFEKRFVLLHYLRSYHHDVWRLLERQPWSLRILHKVLEGNENVSVDLPEGIEHAEQRLLEKLMGRAFAHVLPGIPSGVEDRDQWHLDLPLGEAVELASERIDRKRSDEVFRSRFREIFPYDMDLPADFLYLADRSEGNS